MLAVRKCPSMTPLLSFCVHVLRACRILSVCSSASLFPTFLLPAPLFPVAMLLFLTESRGKFSDRNYRAVASHAIYKSTEQQSILDHPSSSLPASSSPPALPSHRCLRERRDSADVKQVGRQAGSPKNTQPPGRWHLNWRNVYCTTQPPPCS